MQQCLYTLILSVIILSILAYYYSYNVLEGWRPRKSYYNSGLTCNDFCAKIKNEKACTLFNMKENTKCYNNKGMSVPAMCYLHKNRNCMS